MKMPRASLHKRVFVGAAGLLASAHAMALGAESEAVLRLEGNWGFRLDGDNAGIKEKWFDGALPDTIKLPGSTAEAGYGDDISIDTRWTGDIVDRSWFTDSKYAKYRRPGNVKVPFWLSPVKSYVGSAWYQKRVMIPKNWRGKRITLYLERCHWETRVWVDEHPAGTADSLGTAHEYDLSKLLTPGGHRLTIRVDNTIKIDVGVNAHSVSDHTQTNWNGIVGRIRLRATDPVYIDDIQVYPDISRRTARVVVTVGNASSGPVEGVLTIAAVSSYPDAEHVIPPKQVPFHIARSETNQDCEYEMGKGVRLWDEFTPNVYTLSVTARSNRYSDTGSVDFGMREMGVSGTQFTLNGRKTFLRGTLECCIFPLTGYPPTDPKSWLRILKIAKAHGLNHLRFHSWCPPEAAFIAADRMGFIYQVECGVWTKVGENGPTDAFIRAESDRILKAYGNHPSFCLMAHGNEPGGDHRERFLGELVDRWKRKDPRRLYTSAAGWPLIPENDYHVTPEPRIYHWQEKLAGRLNGRPPETMTDYRDFVAKYRVPVISHEIGEWCAYPDFREIERYTGVLRAHNFEIFRDGLAENHMLDQAEHFLAASGKLQALCYKEEIESALRTPGLGGFQLLALQDFPGQGTALVGVLNALWESKGYVTPQAYHRFACETVPLARMAKRVWTSDEIFRAKIEVAHFGPAAIENATVVWRIADPRRRIIADGEFEPRTIELGNGIELGEIAVPLSGVTVATKLVLSVSVEGTDYANDWDLWVYPPKLDTAAPADILVADDLNEQATAALKRGGKVMLIPGPGRVVGDARGPVPPGFTTIFWNTAWTRRQPPHTLGILCHPEHPALREFPTEFHSNWQWWYLITRSQIMILGELPDELRPLVQVIDDWFTNRKLGLVFEAEVDGGKLLVCGIDLIHELNKRPVARQLRRSLMSYMRSDLFSPRHKVDARLIRKLIGGVALETEKANGRS